MAKTNKPSRSKTSKPADNGRKKSSFEDGVRSALIAGVVICAVVLGAGVFFVARSALGGGFSPPAASGAASASNPPAVETGETVPLDDFGDPGFTEDGGVELLPELEDALRQFETENAALDPLAAAPSGQSAVSPSPGGSPPVSPPELKGVLVFVIDDAGNNLRELEPFLAFPGPLTIAVLPGLPNSAEAARRIRAAKKELFLHQPMEPLSGADPGPGAVKTGMGAQEIRAVITKNIDELWPLAGMNNHEGSKASQDKALMKTVLELCRERNIVFLDSRTIADSAAPEIARGMVFPIAQRDVFLDNEQDRNSIIKYIEEGCRKAEQNGLAVMIGHAWSPRLAAILTEMYPALIRQGFLFSTVSAVLDPGK
jgi:polysaccharide deacetylase 2 family uncharacterized protein YibQ